MPSGLRGGSKYKNQSIWSRLSFGMALIFTLKTSSLFDFKFSSFSYVIWWIPLGREVIELLSKSRIVKLTRFRNWTGSRVILLFAHLNIFNWVIVHNSTGSISNSFESRIIWVSFLQWLICPVKYFILLRCAFNLVNCFSCAKIRPSSSTI